MVESINDTEAAINELHTVQDFIRWGASRFNEAELFYGHGTDNAIDEAVTLVLHALHLPHGLTPELMSARLTRQERSDVVDLLARRISKRLPAPYLTHEAWFAGMSFYVDERVLIPRSPIAELVEEGFEPWLGGRPVNRILDLGTGSGCIAVACAQAFPEAVVDAVDASEDALAVARINVARYGLGHRVQVIQSDLFASLRDQAYDLIVTNPPYVSYGEYNTLPQEYHHEPQAGLVGGEDGLDCVMLILKQAIDYLTPGGILVMEVGHSRPALTRRLPRAPFTWPEFRHGGEGVLILTGEQLREIGG